MAPHKNNNNNNKADTSVIAFTCKHTAVVLSYILLSGCFVALSVSLFLRAIHKCRSTRGIIGVNVFKFQNKNYAFTEPENLIA